MNLAGRAHPLARHGAAEEREALERTHRRRVEILDQRDEPVRETSGAREQRAPERVAGRGVHDRVHVARDAPPVEQVCDEHSRIRVVERRERDVHRAGHGIRELERDARGQNDRRALERGEHSEQARVLRGWDDVHVLDGDDGAPGIELPREDRGAIGVVRRDPFEAEHALHRFEHAAIGGALKAAGLAARRIRRDEGARERALADAGRTGDDDRARGREQAPDAREMLGAPHERRGRARKRSERLRRDLRALSRSTRLLDRCGLGPSTEDTLESLRAPSRASRARAPAPSRRRSSRSRAHRRRVRRARSPRPSRARSGSGSRPAARAPARRADRATRGPVARSTAAVSAPREHVASSNPACLRETAPDR